MRKLRKSLGICRGVCASRASLAAFAVSVPPGVCRPGFRPGLWSTGPTARPGTGERPVGAPDHSQGRNPWCVDDRGETPGVWTIGAKPWGGGYPMRSNTGGAVHPFGPVGPVWGAYSIRPYTGTCIRVPGQIRRRPQTPAPTPLRAFAPTGRVPGQLPCLGRGCPQTPPGGMLWASSRRPIRGERRPRWGLHAARSAGC